MSKQSSIAFFGLGGVGLSALMCASLFKCSKVIAVDIFNEKLEFSKILGATHVINALEVEPLSAILEITNGNGVDYSVEATGQIKSIESAFDCLKSDGSCVFASHPPAGEMIRIDPFELICGKTIRGTWGGSCCPDNDIPKFASFYKEGVISLEPMITKKYTLESINDALDDLEKNKVFRPLLVL